MHIETVTIDELNDILDLALWAYTSIQGGSLEPPPWVRDGLPGIVFDEAYDWADFPVVVLDTGLRVEIQGDLGSLGTRINIGVQREGSAMVWLDLGHNYPS